MENSEEIDKVIEGYEREFQKERKMNYIDYVCLKCSRSIPGSGRTKLPLNECYCSNCQKELMDE